MGCGGSSIAAAQEPRPRAQLSNGMELTPGQVAIIRNCPNARLNGEQVILQEYNHGLGEWTVKGDKFPLSIGMSLGAQFLEVVEPAPTLLTSEACANMTTGFELTVNLMSAETLCVLTVEPSWTIGHVKELVQARLDLDKTLKALISDSSELKDEDMLSTAQLEKAAMVTAVVIALPTLHLFEPCSARELSERRGCGTFWNFNGDDHIVAEGVQHLGMEGVSPGTLQVVQEMAKAAPDLEYTRVAGCESDENGEIIVISNPGNDPKQACFQALKFYIEQDGDILWKRTTLEEMNWGEHLQCGFNMDPDDYDDEDADAGLLAITKLMSEHLSQHFLFGFSGIVVAPWIYGGYTTEGDIVGVLSARVWT